jgi:(5-formylfuran-3-yl)methyl phosphate synthase
MTRLLVSVRDREEALAALEGGADLIDIKEPTRGALGAAETAVWNEIRTAVDGRAPLSVALGELRDLAKPPQADHFHGFSYAKAGLAGLRNDRRWSRRLEDFSRSLPPSTSLVAVAYADAAASQAPEPEEVVGAAITLGIPVVLFDSFDKTRGDLWSLLGPPAVKVFASAARRQGIKVALAGSLTPVTIPPALALAPDWIAVRGAACVGDRLGRVERAQVARLAALVHGPAPNIHDFPGFFGVRPITNFPENS